MAHPPTIPRVQGSELKALLIESEVQAWRKKLAMKHLINEEIISPSLRVVYPDGKSLIKTRTEALQDAKKLDLDLVQLPRGAHDDGSVVTSDRDGRVPVVKIMSFKALVETRLRHLELNVKSQKQQEKMEGVKQIRFTCNIAGALE
jgi:translation initiation factor IF-3